ncbi:MAG: tyrosine-protein phosphatase [Bacteroidota bacterium]
MTRLYLYPLSSLLSGIMLSCASLQSLDAVYPVNPIADETPVYRNSDGQIIIDLARVSPALTLPVTVYHGRSEESINRTQPLGVSDDYSFWWDGADRQQHFFELVDASGTSVVVAERQLYFQGTNNTRDLGGYRTSDGQRVRWGLLYRSDDLGGLKRSDWDYWRRVGIHQVVDFREPEALERKPDRLPADTALVIRHYPVYDTTVTRRDNRKLLQRANPDTYNAETILLDNNRLYVEQYTPVFAQVFAELLQPSQPLLYHCSAGKDRTGFMSAMILYVLGVPRATIVRDYMASNHYRRKRIRRRARLSPLIGISRRVSLPLLEVRPIYLEQAFQAIEEKYGSLDNYVQEGLQLSMSERQALQKKYLTEK